jgi:hypothetical protein
MAHESIATGLVLGVARDRRTIRGHDTGLIPQPRVGNDRKAPKRRAQRTTTQGHVGATGSRRRLAKNSTSGNLSACLSLEAAGPPVVSAFIAKATNGELWV